MQIANALIAKCRIKEAADLAPGTHYIDEELTVRTGKGQLPSG